MDTLIYMNRPLRRKTRPVPMAKYLRPDVGTLATTLPLPPPPGPGASLCHTSNMPAQEISFVKLYSDCVEYAIRNEREMLKKRPKYNSPATSKECLATLYNDDLCAQEHDVFHDVNLFTNKTPRVNLVLELDY